LDKEGDKMKVLLYQKGYRFVEKSGVGRAIRLQENALAVQEGVEVACQEGEDYDVVHLNTVFPSSCRMAKRARRQGKAVVFHGHSTEADFRNSFIGSNLLAPLFRKWIRYCYNLGDLVLTPTPYSRMLLMEYGVRPPVQAVSNGVDTEFFQKHPLDRQGLRRRFGFQPEDQVILSVGLPIARKGILDFIEMAREMPDVKFLWFGQISRWLLPEEVRSSMEKAPENVIFPGFADRETLRMAYGGCDLFLFLTNEETEGLVLLEALSCRTPVLLRDIPVYEEWLTDRKHVYKEKSREGFFFTARRMLEGRMPDLTEAGHGIAEERALEKTGEHLAKAYRALEKYDIMAEKVENAGNIINRQEQSYGTVSYFSGRG